MKLILRVLSALWTFILWFMVAMALITILTDVAGGLSLATALAQFAPVLVFAGVLLLVRHFMRKPRYRPISERIDLEEDRPGATG
jgi:positive regulator of sigma E activity